jgi:YfiH family protein
VSDERDPAGAAPPLARVAAWDRIAGLRHAFFGRGGGVSRGPWGSLNVSDRVGDDPHAVAANWHQVRLAAPDLSFVRMLQVHGARVLSVERAAESLEEADGMITRTAGLGLAVLSADCVPVLCVAPDAQAVMALHAGWRGTLAGVVSAGLAAARDRYGIQPATWQVALGPSIAACCYEVEAHIGERLVERWGAMPDAWRPAGARGMLDLRAANRQILVSEGVPETQIVDVGPCTSCHQDEYFSHRGSGGNAGRQLSVVGWAA